MPHLFANDYTFDDDDNLSFAYSLWQWLKKYIKPAMDTCAQSHLACSEFLLKMVLFFVMRRIMPHYVILFVIILLNVAWEIKYEVELIWFLTAFSIKAAGSSEVIPFQSICLQKKEGFNSIFYGQLYIGKLADYISIIIVSFFLPVYRILLSYRYAQGSKYHCFTENIFLGPCLWE